MNKYDYIVKKIVDAQEKIFLEAIKDMNAEERRLLGEAIKRDTAATLDRCKPSEMKTEVLKEIHDHEARRVRKN